MNQAPCEPYHDNSKSYSPFLTLVTMAYKVSTISLLAANVSIAALSNILRSRDHSTFIIPVTCPLQSVNLLRGLSRHIREIVNLGKEITR